MEKINDPPNENKSVSRDGESQHDINEVMQKLPTRNLNKMSAFLTVSSQ